MTPTTISVLMPVYNAERYVAEAVESILAQTFSDFEFLIIDDGSTDRSLDILRRLAAQDSRIHVISRPNTGCVVALNDGLAKATGEFMARMDADDVSLPERFALQVNYLRQNPKCVAVGCGAILVDPDGDPISLWNSPLTHEEIDSANLRGKGGAAILHPATMFRLDALRLVNGYRPELETAEDVDLYLRLAETGRLANVPDVLFKYRRHFGSIGLLKREQQERVLEKVIRQAHQRRGIDGHGLPLEPSDSAPMNAVDYQRMWAWWALSSGYYPTARKHAFAVLGQQPFSTESWRVAYCALRGR